LMYLVAKHKPDHLVNTTIGSKPYDTANN
jgi:hypothetical protein